jgi:hypothetical protein
VDRIIWYRAEQSPTKPASLETLNAQASQEINAPAFNDDGFSSFPAIRRLKQPGPGLPLAAFSRQVLQWKNRNRAHQNGSGIAGSRGVRFSSRTEPDVDDWFGSKMWNGDGPKASPAVWDHAGFIEGRGFPKREQLGRPKFDNAQS